MNVALHHDPRTASQNTVPGHSKDFEDFIYLISHDVRSSVRALIEVPQWISEDLTEAGQKIEGSLADNLDLMNTQTRRLDRMLTDLLVYSRIGRMQNVLSVDLAEAVDSVCQELVVPKSIQLSVDLRQTQLNMGERDIMTLLTALLSNSIRHRDDRTTRISLASSQEGDTCVMTFQDDGPGIAPQFRDRVFDAMTTLKSRDEAEGSGMGLAHVRKILDCCGGTLKWLDLPSERGVGFELRFPN